MDKYFEAERVLSEMEREAVRQAREFYPTDRGLSEQFARLVKEIRWTKAEVLQVFKGIAA